jgi:tetratricopeptide (TPR) repeat protein
VLKFWCFAAKDMDRRRRNAILITMKAMRHLFNIALAAGLCLSPMAAGAEESRVDALLDRLADPDLRNWDVTEQEIFLLWSRSGSASADYLLQRGRAAMDAGDLQSAYGHFTALTDHAPEFAEGWNARATVLFQMQRFGPSIADIQRVLALEPRHFGALMGLGMMLEEMQLYDEATEAFTLAVEIHPHRDDIRRALQRVEQMREGRTL